MNQLGLPISLNSSMLLDNFVANEELLRSINQLFEDQISSELYIYGLSGNGKTHVPEQFRGLSINAPLRLAKAKGPEQPNSYNKVVFMKCCKRS